MYSYRLFEIYSAIDYLILVLQLLTTRLAVISERGLISSYRDSILDPESIDNTELS